MTTTAEGHDPIAERLDGLTDLFKRRLLEDRTKQAVIEDLQARLTRAEKALSAASLRPLVDGLGLVIERLQSAEPTADFSASIAEELEYVLESLGIQRIDASPGDIVDRLRHEVTAATGTGTRLQVETLVRPGYEKDGIVLRTALITAVRTETEESAGSTGAAIGEVEVE